MRFFYLWLLLLLIISCQNKKPQKSYHCTNHYANHFSVFLNQDSSFTIKVINPYQGSLGDTFTYLLSHKKNKSNAIHIPVKKVAIFSTTYIGFLDALNELSSIIAISCTNQIYNTKIINRISQGQIFETGFENSINYEKLALSKPDVVFIYSVSKETMPYVEKIKSLGISVVYVAEFMEEHPLGRAEWIKFFGSFFEKSIIADSIFRTIEHQYDSIKQLAQSLQNHPTVFLNIPYQGIWYMPQGNSYMANLIKDAGGNYLYQKTIGNQILKFDFEKVLTDAINADIWLNPGFVKTKKELYENDQRYSLFKAYKNSAIFNQTLRINAMGGNDFWESGVVNPHLILEDLYHIFKNDTNFTFHFYQKLK
ncbi:MAG: ABC transporter substrate-binding protein [Bacteroidales bacterium]